PSTSANDSSISLDCETPPHGKYECLAQFFDAEEFLQMPDYEKDSYLTAKENYKYGVSLGLHLEKPAFVRLKQGPESSTVVEKLYFNVQPEICSGISEVDIDQSRNSRMHKAVDASKVQKV
ncbi:Histone-lysine N-methyltransferase PRDM9, partial [Frankliniella fusca]